MLDLEPLAACWQLALDSAERALRTAGAVGLTPSELAERQHLLAAERRLTADALAGLFARDERVEAVVLLAAGRAAVEVGAQARDRPIGVLAGGL